MANRIDVGKLSVPEAGTCFLALIKWLKENGINPSSIEQHKNIYGLSKSNMSNISSKLKKGIRYTKIKVHLEALAKAFNLTVFHDGEIGYSFSGTVNMESTIKKGQLNIDTFGKYWKVYVPDFSLVHINGLELKNNYRASYKISSHIVEEYTGKYEIFFGKQLILNLRFYNAYVYMYLNITSPSSKPEILTGIVTYNELNHDPVVSCVIVLEKMNGPVEAKKVNWDELPETYKRFLTTKKTDSKRIYAGKGILTKKSLSDSLK